MELLQGALNAKELIQIKKDLQGFYRLPIQQPILNEATRLLSAYKLSHQAKIPDMIIAATALHYNIALQTYNTKDFHFIPNLKVFNPIL
jgi:tRNA(fMet)-specific endonuclease VapC